VAASGGPPNACVVDKIRQFNTELAAPGTDPQERIIALKFLLHFVGDVHQPLHSADDHDQGGNSKRVSARGFPAGNLHHFWDTEFVEQWKRRRENPSLTEAAGTSGCAGVKLRQQIAFARSRQGSGDEGRGTLWTGSLCGSD